MKIDGKILATAKVRVVKNSDLIGPYQTQIKGLKIKMANSNKTQNSSDIEEYLRDLLECPVCLETIKSVPVYQCNNGHVICKDCIKKLNNCPICRNDSAPARSLQLEKIVQRLEGIQPENEGTIAPKPNLQKWGIGSVRSYGTINNGPNQVTQIENNLQTNSRQTTPRHAITRQQSMTRQPMPIQQATPRQVMNRQQATSRQATIMINNQDVGAGWQSISLKQRCVKCCKLLSAFLVFGIFLVCFGYFLKYLANDQAAHSHTTGYTQAGHAQAGHGNDK